MSKRIIQLFVVILVVILALLLLRASSVSIGAERIVYSTLQPLVSFGYSLRTKFVTIIDSRYSDRHTIDTLESETQRLQIDGAACQQLAIENQTLRTQLEFSRTQPLKPILAQIIGSSEDQGSRVLLLDRGSHDGIIVGSAVVTKGSVFVGTVSSVQDSVSYLLLPHDDRSSIIVSIFKNNTELSGIAHGRFRIGILLDKVQQDIQLSKGDSIVTSVLNNSMPPGLLIGTVREVISTPNDLFQRATVTPALSYDAVRIVSVISK